MSNIDIVSKGIKKIYEMIGNEAFTNAKQFHALLGDIAPTLTTERKILRSAVDDSILKELSVMFCNSATDKRLEAIKIKKKLEDNNGLSEKWSLFIVESFANASGFHINIATNSKISKINIPTFSESQKPQTFVPEINNPNSSYNMVSSTPKNNQDSNRIMKVEDRYKITGKGTVLYGTLLHRQLNNGDTVIVNRNKYTITAIVMEGKILKYADPGDKISVLVKDLALRNVECGDWICSES